MQAPEPDALPPELKAAMTRYQAPPGLKRRIRFMLDQQERALALPRGHAGNPWWQGWMPLGASFACGALLSVLVLQWSGQQGSAQASLEQELLSGHLRSLQVSHLADVASSDQHTVKPWFTGKLDYAPPVLDLASQGFPLVGGRLDLLQGQPTAALVYRRRQHTVNVFVRPALGQGSPDLSASRRQGFNIVGWRSADMQFWAVSDLGPDELKQLALALRSAHAG